MILGWMGLVTLLMCASCSPKPQDTGTLGLALGGDPETLDPGKMSGSIEGSVALSIYEGLWMPAQSTGDPVYGVVQSHTVSEDGRTWTLTLRKSVWNNGDPVTSADFLYAWRRVLTPGFDADYAEFLDVIDGAAAYRKGENANFSTVGVSAPDPHTLKIRLVNPTPYLRELLAFYTFFPVHQATLEAYPETWMRPENLVTNGAYRLKTVRHQQSLILEKSPSFWDAASVSIPRVKMQIIKDNTAALNAFRAHRIHVLSSSIPIGQIPALRGKKEFRIDPMLGTYFFRLNVDANEALAKKNVRRALSLAVDRKALTQRTLKGLHMAGTGFVPPMPGYTSSVKMGFEPDRARTLLADAGYPNGKDFPTLTLLYNTSDNHKLIAEIIQDMWRRELGIDVRLENKEWKMYLQDIDRRNYQVGRAGWIGDYNDPLTFLSIFTTGNGNNDTGWGDPRYDKLLKDAQAEPDTAKRMALMAQAEVILMEASPIVPIYFYRAPVLISPKLEGYLPHNRDVHLIRYLKLR